MSQSSSSNLWMLLEVVARRRGFILTTVIIVTLIGLGISLVLPKYFKSTAVLLPPKDTSIPVSGISRLAEVVSVTKGLNLPVMVTATDVYARMLKSRRVLVPVIEDELSYEALDARNEDEAVKAFISDYTVAVTDEGLLEISYESRDPQKAAEVVGAIVEELDLVNRSIATSRAKQNRQFIENRLEQVEQEMDSSRAALERFQMTNKAVDFDEQIRLATEQAIELKVRLAEIELSLGMMKDKYGPDNTELKELKRRRAIIVGQIESLENSNSDSSFFSLPIAAVPALRGQYEELYSKVRVSEVLFQTLLSQHEQAKIQENEEVPTITVLDQPRPADLKSRPKRAYIVIAAFGFSLITSLLLAVFFEYLRRIESSQDEDHRRAALFFSTFFGWLPGVKRLKQS